MRKRKEDDGKGELFQTRVAPHLDVAVSRINLSPRNLRAQLRASIKANTQSEVVRRGFATSRPRQQSCCPVSKRQ